MHRRLITATTCALLIGGLAACGSDGSGGEPGQPGKGDDDPKAAAELISKADAICTERRDHAARFGQDYQKALEKAGGSKAPQKEQRRLRGELLLRTAAAANASNTELQALIVKNTPNGTARIAKYVAATTRVTDTLNAMGQALLAGRTYSSKYGRQLLAAQRASISTLAGYGFKVCGSQSTSTGSGSKTSSSTTASS